MKPVPVKESSDAKATKRRSACLWSSTAVTPSHQMRARGLPPYFFPLLLQLLMAKVAIASEDGHCDTPTAPPPPPPPPQLAPPRFQHSTVDERCPRFIYGPMNDPAGIGQKVGEFCILLTHALKHNATLVYRGPQMWGQFQGVHGSYPWAEDFFR